MPSETNPAFLKAGFVVFKAELFGTIFQRVFISIKIRCTDKGCATDDIAQEYGNHIEEKLSPSDVCACQNTCGITNILATRCWKPFNTKIMTGNQMASIRPVMFLAAKCNHAPMQTIQLHATADTKARPKSIWPFGSPS